MIYLNCGVVFKEHWYLNRKIKQHGDKNNYNSMRLKHFTYKIVTLYHHLITTVLFIYSLSIHLMHWPQPETSKYGPCSKSNLSLVLGWSIKACLRPGPINYKNYISTIRNLKHSLNEKCNTTEEKKGKWKERNGDGWVMSDDSKFTTDNNYLAK